MIDITLYDELGISTDHKITTTEQVYSRDETILADQAKNILDSSNPLLRNLQVSDAVTGFEKKATWQMQENEQ